MKTNCPCCSHKMLRHIRSREVYWFCRQCWQEMPVLDPTPNTLSSFAGAIGIANQELNLSLLNSR